MLNAFYIIAGLMAVGCVMMFVISAMTPRPSSIGVVNGQLAAVPDSPNCVSSTAEDQLHAIAPLTWTGSQQDAMQKLRSVVSGMPGATIVEQQDGYLYAEFRSRLFQYVDDVEFLVDTDAGVIQFRSASRVGYSDMGVNRARMEQIRQRMQPASGQTK